jgi:hypothetical protein
MKKITAIFLSIALITSLSFLCMASDDEHNLVTTATTLIGDTGSFRDEVLKLPNTGGEYLASLSLPKLTNDYTMTGNITMRQVGPNAWNGVRICVGKSAITSWTLIFVTKSMGVMVNNRDPDQGWVGAGIPSVTADNSITLSDGTQFSFKIIKKALHLTFYINDKLIFDSNLAEGADLFTDAAVDNIGFFNSLCAIQVDNLKVIDYNVTVLTPTVDDTSSSVDDQSSATVSTNSYYSVNDNNIFTGYVNSAKPASNSTVATTTSPTTSSSSTPASSITEVSSSSAVSTVSSESTSVNSTVPSNTNKPSSTTKSGGVFFLIAAIVAGVIIIAAVVLILFLRKKNK